MNCILDDVYIVHCLISVHCVPVPAGDWGDSWSSAGLGLQNTGIIIMLSPYIALFYFFMLNITSGWREESYMKDCLGLG